MSSVLSFGHGNVSWISPSLWTASTWSFETDRALPQAGERCYAGALIENHGVAAVDDVEVRFYRAMTGLGLDIKSAQLIGRAFVSVDAGEQVDVQCMSGWITPKNFMGKSNWSLRCMAKITKLSRSVM